LTEICHGFYQLLHTNALIYVGFEVLTAVSTWLSSGLYSRVVWQKFTNVSEVLAASIIRAMSDALMMTRRYNPEDSHLRLDICHKCSHMPPNNLYNYFTYMLHCIRHSNSAFINTRHAVHMRDELCVQNYRWKG
jgi:hypothetical protein